MQTLTDKILRLSPPGGLFDTTVVRNLFPETSEGVRKLLVYRALAAGEAIRLKPGLFILEAAFRRPDPHPFVIAAMLHSPSHVSLESALSHHGLIPEAVYQVSSVTVARSRSFDTPVGRFMFQRVSARHPRAGVEAARLGKEAWAFVASPLRVIADLIYLRPSVTWERDGIEFLTGSLRIESTDLVDLDFSPCAEIQESLRSPRTRRYLEGLKEEVER